MYGGGYCPAQVCKIGKEDMGTERKLRVNDFFCGCGGMGTAFLDAGFEIAGAWDIDKFAVQTYRENVWPGVEQRDIKGLTYKEIPRADVWSFGFPCQDLSVAGKRRGMRLGCLGCGLELAVSPEGYEKCICPACGGVRFRAVSRSGMFFEVMRLLEETGREAPGNLPAVIIAENVKGLRPYLPVLEQEYKRLGYTAYAKLFNSKFWGVAQNRERYAVVGTRDGLGIEFSFPEECRDYVPRLSSQLEKGVDGKYYLPEWKQEAIIAQAAERVRLENCHACIAPDYVAKRQRGPRARAEEEPVFTLTAQGLQGVIIREDSIRKDSILPGTEGDREGQDPVCPAEDDRKLVSSYCKSMEGELPRIMKLANCYPSGYGMSGNVFWAEGIAPTLTAGRDMGVKVMVEEMPPE